MPIIFVSYRREDAPGYAGRLCDGLQQEFGRSNIFIDVDTLQPGDDFVEKIHERLNGCDLVLAVIGRRWLAVTDAQGNRRLEQPDDYVRLEVETALARQIVTVPVLVEGAAMPRADDLPLPLRPLARRQAIELSDTRWAYDIARLVTHIGRTTSRKRPLWKSLPVSAAAAAAALAIAFRVWFWPVGDAPLDPPPSPVSQPAEKGRTPALPPSTAPRDRQPPPAAPAPAERTRNPAEQSQPGAAAKRESAAPDKDTVKVSSSSARVDELTRSAQKNLQSGATGEALTSVIEGLKLDPGNAALRLISDELLRDAQARLTRAKAEAIEAGATVSLASYSEALRLEAEATSSESMAPHESVIRRASTASQQFRNAAEDARRQLAAQGGRREEIVRTDKDAGAATASAEAKTAPQLPARPDTHAAEQRTADEQAIRDTLRRYADAYKALNVAAVKAVYPTAPSQLLSRFSQYRSYDMQILHPEITLEGAKATVVCMITARLTPKAGTATSQRASAVFHLQKTGNSWYIVARDVR